jgi:hypothetical protein
LLVFPPEEHDMLKCLVNISKTYFQERRTIAVSVSEEHSVRAPARMRVLPQTHGDLGRCTTVTCLSTALIEQLHFSKLWTIAVHDTGKTNSLLMTNNENDLNYILLLDFKKGIPGFRKQVHQLMNVTHRNSRNLFVVAVINDLMVGAGILQERELATEILTVLWQHRIVNAIVLVEGATENESNVRNGFTAPTNDVTLQIYTWFPYDKCRCEGEGSVVESVLLDQWTRAEDQHFLLRANLFPSKVPTNLHGCPVTISTAPHEPFVLPPTILHRKKNSSNIKVSQDIAYSDGVEIRLINCLASNMNFTPAYRPHVRNGSHCLFMELVTRKSDLVFGGLIGTRRTYTNFDPTVSYLRESYVCFVPHAKPRPEWMNMIVIFQNSVWFLVVLSYIVASCAVCILANVKHERRPEYSGYRNPVPCFIYMLSAFLSSSVAVTPRLWLVRFPFLVWVLYSLQIITAYQSSLISFLTEPEPLPIISNVDELLRSGIKFGALTRSFSHFDTSEDIEFQKILQNIKYSDNLTDLLDRMVFHGDLAVLGGKAHINYLRETHYVRNGKRLFVALKESINNNGIVMYLPKGSLVLDRYNAIIFRVTEAGLMGKWWKDVTQKPNTKQNQDFDDEEDEDGDGEEDHYEDNKERHVLSMSHLEGVFRLWLLGVGVALVVCIIEVASRGREWKINVQGRCRRISIKRRGKTVT